MSSLYTVHVADEYRDFATALLATFSVLLVLHILLSGQRSTGLVGSMFNSPFSETLTKVVVAISFYYLVVKKIVRFD